MKNSLIRAKIKHGNMYFENGKIRRPKIVANRNKNFQFLAKSRDIHLETY